MVASPHPELTPSDIDGYLTRLGIDRRDTAADLAGLRPIHLAHLERVPFENLDIVFGAGVAHDQLTAVDKIIGDRSGASRGGWCFEVNGALALLLEALGYHVRLLGAAVLHDGPSQVIEHLLLEVESPLMLPHLVDVGFGDSFDVPLALNAAGPQDGGSGEFELIGSPQGTTLTRQVDGIPVALLRFKRVAHSFQDFAQVSMSMQIDPMKKWGTRPFATRRLTDDERGGDPGSPKRPQRVALSGSRLKVERAGVVQEQPVEHGRWDQELDAWFKMTRPGPWPPGH